MTEQAPTRATTWTRLLLARYVEGSASSDERTRRKLTWPSVQTAAPS